MSSRCVLGDRSLGSDCFVLEGGEACISAPPRAAQGRVQLDDRSRCSMRAARCTH